MESVENKEKILIIEDDTFILDIYQTKFKQEGFEVATAENGLVAFEKMKEFLPDIILLDIIMPYMDGVEVLQKIKEDSVLKNIPVIMLTNISEKERVEKAMNEGANEFLIKSHFTPLEVVEKVRTLLKKEKIV